MRVLAVWSIKGGVGKTTAAVNLATLAARDGSRTLLWDLDPQGAASFSLRVSPRRRTSPRDVARRASDLRSLTRTADLANLDLLPSDLTYRTLEKELAERKRPTRRLAVKLAPLREYYEWVMLDCAPSVTLISEAVLDAADALLVPVVPSVLSLRTLDQIRAFAADTGHRGMRVLPFLSMVDRRKRLHREACERLADGAEGFLRATVPFASVVERTAERRSAVVEASPRAPASQAFVALWDEVRDTLAAAGRG